MAAAGSLRACESWLARADERPAVWLAGFAIVLAVQISPLWYAAPDGAAYLSIARSIASGEPITRFGDPQVSYPIGYPLLISPAFLTGARPFLVLSLMHWIMAVVFMLGVYRWMRQQVGVGALWLTGLVMANVSVWTLYRRTLSEPAFLAVMMWTVNALDGVLDAGTEPARRPRFGAARSVLVAGCLLVVLTAIREAGVLFGVGLALALLASAVRGAVSRRGAAAALIVTGVAIVLALTSIRPERIAAAGPALAGNLAGYADAGSAISGSLSQRVYMRMSEIGQLLVPGMFHAYGRSWLDINTAVYAPLLVAVVIGWWRLVRRRRDVFAVTAPLYVGVHLLWPYVAGTRYLLPLLPLLVACVWIHLEPHRQWRLGVVALSLLANLGVAVGYWLVRDLPAARACARQWPAVEQLGAHIGADAGAVAAAGVPRCVPLMLALTLNRPVQEDGGPLAGTPARWMVVPERADPVSGFAPAASAGPYTLLRRR